MSLRYQIISRIVMSSLVVLLLGGVIAVRQAKNSVAREVQASTHLALELISLKMSGAPSFQQPEDLSHLQALRQTRHLNIQIKKPDGGILNFAGGDPAADRESAQPPQWFIQWVGEDYPAVEHQLRAANGDAWTLIIQARPLDEINEAWQESAEYFTGTVLMVLVTFIAVNLAFDKSLKAISVIVAALGKIEAGDYQCRLPAFAAAEFNAIARAVTNLSAELDKTRRENRALTQHSLSIQEEERRRLSQELHDELGQSLTAIKVMAITAREKPEQIPKTSAAIVDICNHLMQVVRNMMQQLHPLILNELGLKATLEDLTAQWMERNAGISLNFHCSDAADAIPGDVAIQLFRVIQECLTNIVRHSGAHAATLDLDVAAGSSPQARLSVRDDGRGCDLDRLRSGFGLLSIGERVRSLDGELDIASQPGGGMSIAVRIPL